ncbi:MAG: hypothetical protein IKS17_08565 [Firmicutes bacterium]|nr:hypothetical protein [Bacillota bacterium]
MEEMTKSIDEILLSIESNQQTIVDMLNTAKQNNTMIAGEMQHYARTHACLNKEQMTAYAEYARAYDSVKQVYTAARDMTNVQSIHNIPNQQVAYSLLDEMHTRQLGFMEQLCGMLEKAGQALKMLRTES